MNMKGIAGTLMVGCGACAAMAQQVAPQFPKGTPPPYPSAARALPASSPAIPNAPSPAVTQLPPPNAPVPPDMPVGSASLASATAATSAPSPATATPIPDGYVRLQMSSAFRGRTAAERLNDIQRIAQMMQQTQPGTNIAGVALADKETGQIVATFDRAALGLDKASSR